MKKYWVVGSLTALMLAIVTPLFSAPVGLARQSSKLVRMAANVDKSPDGGVVEPSGMETSSAMTGAGKMLVSYDDGKMEDRMSLTASGATVEFTVPEDRVVTAIQFFGARYGAKVMPGDSFTVYISDGSFKQIARADKPLINVSPGRETWQTVAIIPPVRVNGMFYATLVYNSVIDKGIYLGADTTAAHGFSKTGVPGTVASDVESPLNWMIRASTQKPGEYDAAKAKAAKPAIAKTPVPKPVAVTSAQSAISRPVVSSPKPKVSSGTTHPGQGAAVVAKPGKVRQPMVKSNTGGAKVAYRSPDRRLILGPSVPRIPRGSGRVDVTWTTPPPVTVELNYIGKPTKTLEDLDVKRFVVDFPVAEPGLFNVVVRKPGFNPVSKQFRVVAGGRQEWRANLTVGGEKPHPPITGLTNGVPAGGERVRPTIEDNSPPTPDIVMPTLPADGNTGPAPSAPGIGPNDNPAVDVNPGSPAPPPARANRATRARPSSARSGARGGDAPLPPKPDVDRMPEPPPAPGQ